MSKSNYKVYNGKALKRILENSRYLIMPVLFTVGIIFGASSIKINNNMFENISEITRSYFAQNLQQGIVDNFLASFKISAAFMMINVFLGFSLIGYPFILWLPFVKGIGLGAVTGYLYSAFRLTGFCYCLLTVYPGAVVSAVALIIACNDSCLYSQNAFMKSIRGRGQFEKDETKFYLIRQFMFLGICAVSSLSDAILSGAFSRFLEI